ncbi:MAG: matrixin family metalloprotease, partial [Clostridia bacterium]|nr:matrixin family metalloprotease [Clostridia bacterium]
SSAVQAAYRSYVGGGIGLWGTNISMTCISDVDSAGLEIKVSNKITDATASTLVNSVDSETGHRTKCTITIYPNFDLTSHTYDGKIRTIAHELGHVYGLGHVTFTSSIMYGVYSTTKDVTSQDIWGMKVVTHIHSHGVLVLGTTYEFIDATYHYITCNSCKGKIKRVHTPDGNGVCSCGYTGPYVYP